MEKGGGQERRSKDTYCFETGARENDWVTVFGEKRNFRGWEELEIRV